MHTEAGAAIQNHYCSGVINLSKPQRGIDADVEEQQSTIFQSCLESHHLDADEKKLNRLAQEAFTIIVAGGETTARVLTTATFYMIEHKERVIPRLRDELRSISSDSSEELSLKALEQLPWLVSHVTSKCETPLIVVTVCHYQRIPTYYRLGHISTTTHFTRQSLTLQRVDDPSRNAN